MVIKELFRLCPVCNSDSGYILHSQKFAKIQDSPLPEKYDVVSCHSCGFVFADTTSSQEDYNLYYSNLSKYEDCNISSGSAFNKSDYERLLRTALFIESHIGKEKEILDLGCANGGLLNILRDRGFLNLTGIDPSKKCVNNVLKNEIKAIQTNLFSQQFVSLDQQFDVIILSHVFEHIRDLVKAVSIIRSKLAKNGLIYVEVPDASRYKDYFIVPYYYVDCEHINHFSPVSLNNLFLNYGFSEIVHKQDTILIKEGVEYPVFYSLFVNNQLLNSHIDFDSLASNSFNKFIELSNDNSRSLIFQKIKEFNKPVIIWGAGQYALRVLSDSEFPKEKILAFVDSDFSKHYKKIHDIEIYPPEYIIGKDCVLIICSALYSDNIAESARNLNDKAEYFIL